MFWECVKNGRITRVQKDYVTGTVKEKYLSLFLEIKRNSELLDNYLEEPPVASSIDSLFKIESKI